MFLVWPLHHPRFRLPTRRRCRGVSRAEAYQSNGGFIMGRGSCRVLWARCPAEHVSGARQSLGLGARCPSSAGRDARTQASLRSAEVLFHRDAVFLGEQSEPLLPFIACTRGRTENRGNNWGARRAIMVCTTLLRLIPDASKAPPVRGAPRDRGCDGAASKSCAHAVDRSTGTTCARGVEFPWSRWPGVRGPTRRAWPRSRRPSDPRRPRTEGPRGSGTRRPRGPRG